METILSIAIPVILGILLLKLLTLPMKWAMKLALHALGGFVCLWLLNCVSGITGLVLPINAVTVLISGICGIPGIILIAVLSLF